MGVRKDKEKVNIHTQFHCAYGNIFMNKNMFNLQFDYQGIELSYLLVVSKIDHNDYLYKYLS